MPVTRVERRARALFAAVLHLYPASYRDEYGREMTLVLVDRLRGEHTAVARVVVFLGAIAAVLADAPKQHALVLAQDLRLALRLIRRERWFATVAIGTVAIGIALSTAVFSVGKSLLVDALPYREAERATMVWVTNPRQGYDRDVTSYPRLLAWREHSQLIEAFAGYAFRRAVVTGIGDPEQLLVVRATPEFFGVVQTEPVAGRLFAATEEQAAVVVLGYGLWQRKFGGNAERGRSNPATGFGPAHHHRCAAAVVSVPRTRSGRVGSIATERRGTEQRRLLAARPSGDSSPVCHLHRRNKK